LFSASQWRQSADSTALLGAVKLQQLAIDLDKLLLKEVPAALGGAAIVEPSPAQQTPQTTPGQAQDNPSQPPGGEPRLDVAVVQVEPRPAQPDNRFLAFAGLAVVLIAIGVVVAVLRRPQRGRKSAVELRDKLDNLDDLLAEGRISEHNYERLRNKYVALQGELKKAEKEQDGRQKEGRRQKAGARPASRPPKPRAKPPRNAVRAKR
jgi:gas vesicle protein